MDDASSPKKLKASNNDLNNSNELSSSADRREAKYKGLWKEHEDGLLLTVIGTVGTTNWTLISAAMADHGCPRSGKQCRERWHNNLDPSVNKEPWTKAEDETIIRLHKLFGNQWTKMGEDLPGRPANAIKNRWNSTLSRLLGEPHPRKDKLKKREREETEDVEHSPERKKRRGRKAAVKPRDGIEEKEEGEGEEEEEEEEEEDDDEYEEGGRRRDGHAATDNESEHRLYNGYAMSQLPYPSDDGAMTEQVNLSSERDQAASETEAIRESIDGQFYYPPAVQVMTGAGGSLPHGEYLPFYPNLNREPIYAPNYPPSSWDYIAQEGHINSAFFDEQNFQSANPTADDYFA